MKKQDFFKILAAYKEHKARAILSIQETTVRRGYTRFSVCIGSLESTRILKTKFAERKEDLQDELNKYQRWQAEFNKMAA